MIQRIQSLYLFLVIVLTIGMFFLPLSISQSRTETPLIIESHVIGFYKIESGNELKPIYNHMGDIVDFQKTPEANKTFIAWSLILFPLNGLVIFFTLITIFIYRKRKVQIRLGKLNLLLNAGLVTVIFFLMEIRIQSVMKTPDFSTVYLIGAYIPFASLALTYLANKAIKKDEELVRTIDRIR